MSSVLAGRRICHGWLLVFFVAGLFGLPAPSSAQDEPETSPPAVTTSDATIPVDNLQVILRPFAKDELKVELNGWLGLLRAQIREVGETELKLKALDENDSGEELRERLITLRTDEAALVERARIVVDALKTKGGDVQDAEQFINAVSDISETTDATSRWAALIAAATNWIGRNDGGKFWARRSLVAVIILFVFWLISKVAGRLTARALARQPRASTLLENFARRTAGGVVFIVGIMLSLSTLGVPLGPLMALVGGGGFIVGFALQETLGNFASGMLIMVYRPFDVDDYVTVAGASGTVKEMSLVATTLLAIDNKVLVIPNKKAWSDTITNFTGKDIRRVDLVFGIGYDDDIQHAMNVLRKITTEHELILDEPSVNVQVDELADSSVNLICRPWVKTADYWTVHWDLTRQVKERFDAEGISIPYPQRDLHMYQPGANP